MLPNQEDQALYWWICRKIFEMKSIYIEEALYRLVEIYYLIGLTDEAKKYAKLLGYNYQSSEWYEKSYVMFDKKYSNNKRILTSKNKKSNILIRKFKSLFDWDEKKWNYKKIFKENKIN